jgi:hypothetical protein
MSDDQSASTSQENSYSLQLTAAELKVTHTALKSFMDDFGHKEHEIGDLVREVLAKFPPESEIEAIDISKELG